MKRWLIVFLSLGWSGWFIVKGPEPLLWLGFVWAGVVLMASRRTTRTRLRMILVNVGTCLLILALADLGCWVHLREQNREANRYRYGGSYINGYYWDHQFLGYAGVRNATLSARKTYGDQILYDVTYTIGEHGFRVAPPALPEATDALFFAGDSFMHGEGVEDDETTPYQVGLLTQAAYRIFNFAFHGYGPHQLLRGLESGLYGYIAGTNPSVVVYGLLTEHGMRAAGLARWDRKGPWYEEAPDGTVVLRGTFQDQDRSAIGRKRHVVELVAKRCALARMVWPERARTTRAHLDLVVALLKKSQALVEQAYRARFLVLFWDTYTHELNTVMQEKLKQAGVPFVNASEAIPDMKDHPERYFIEKDLHPNATTDRLMAEFLVKCLALEGGALSTPVAEAE